VQEVIIEIGLIHLADIAKHDGALRLAGFHHNEGDAATIWPVTALTKKNSSQFGHGKILNRVRKVNDTAKFCSDAICGSGNKREFGAGPNDSAAMEKAALAK